MDEIHLFILNSTFYGFGPKVITTQLYLGQVYFKIYCLRTCVSFIQLIFVAAEASYSILATFLCLCDCAITN